MKNNLLTLCFCLLAIGTVWAQDLSIEDSIAWSIDVEDVVVTAQYEPTHYKEAVHEIKVIKAATFREQGQTNLAEVLTNQLNMRVQTDPILGNGLAIQGIGGENVLVMIDGVPVIGRVNGNIDLSQILLQDVARIEIIEGALSAQYGSNAAGGVINVITQKSQLEKWKISSQHQFENIGLQQHSLQLGSQFGGLYASLSANYTQAQFASEDSLRVFQTQVLSDGTAVRTRAIPWNPKEQLGLSAQLGYQFSERSKLRYRGSWFDETLDRLGEIRRPQFRPYAFDEFYTTQRQDHSLDFTTSFGDYYLQSLTAFNEFERIKTTERWDIEQNLRTLVEGQQDTSQFRALMHRNILNKTINDNWSAQAGLEIRLESGSGQRIVDSTSNNINQTRLDNYAFWAGAKYQLSKQFQVQGQLRYGYNTKFNHPVIPAIHMSWRPLDHWQMKASYATGFRAPGIKELHFYFIDTNHFILGNQALRPEYSQNVKWMLGFDQKLRAEWPFRTDLSLFYNQIKDRIILAEFEPARFNYQNLEQFETFGGNWTASIDMTRVLQFKTGLAYTWQRSSGVNSWLGSAEMQQELSYRLPLLDAKLVLVHRFIGQQLRFYEQADGTLERGTVDPYHLINATLSKSFWQERIFLSLGGKNLLDVQQVPTTGSSGGTHSSNAGSQLIDFGRNWWIRLQLQFGSK
ncbi:MAG: TonB-dependent receptor [Saprospiraceae bacterium]|nr:TonB-dependent receptor [Saprospiraceae bacterium]